MSIYMHIHNLVRFYKVFLKILSGNEKVMTNGPTDERTNGMTDDQNPI